MTTRARTLVALSVFAVLCALGLAAAPSADAHPLPTYSGIPRCIATTWAAHHFHAPKTRPGQTCLNPLVRQPWDGVSSPGVAFYDPLWTPATWKPVAILWNGDMPVGWVTVVPTGNRR
jgi:hypothetical protein